MGQILPKTVSRIDSKMNPSSKKSIISDKWSFSLEQLTGKIRLDSFICQIDEYNEYLLNEAARAQNDQMAITFYQIENYFSSVLIQLILVIFCIIQKAYSSNYFVASMEVSKRDGSNEG